MDTGEYVAAEEFADNVTLTLDRAMRHAHESQRLSHVQRTVRAIREAFKSDWSLQFQETSRDNSNDHISSHVEKVWVDEDGDPANQLQQAGPRESVWT